MQISQPLKTSRAKTTANKVPRSWKNAAGILRRKYPELKAHLAKLREEWA